MKKVLTFGLKQTFKGEDRLETLKQFILEHKINIVFDVRYSTGNYYTKWNCNGDHIKKMVNSLAKESDLDLVYVHWQDCGIPYTTRKKFENRPEDMKAYYLKYIKDNNLFQAFLTMIPETAIVVLLCVENLADPKTKHCHRIWLKEYLDNLYNLEEDV